MNSHCLDSRQYQSLNQSRGLGEEVISQSMGSFTQRDLLTIELQRRIQGPLMNPEK